MSVKALSLGGSLVAPGHVDIAFLKDFKKTAMAWLEANAANKLIIIVGGGAPARLYQNALRSLNPQSADSSLDWIGIAATKLNAQLVKELFNGEVLEPVAENPETAPFNKGRILVASGWKPGFSSDYDAVVLAQRFGAKQLVNLSNIDCVYSADPKKDSQAKPLERISWQDFRKLVGDKWTPGANLPFDPIAAALADQYKLNVIVANGKDLNNLTAILNGGAFRGTAIS